MIDFNGTSNWIVILCRQIKGLHLFYFHIYIYICAVICLFVCLCFCFLLVFFFSFLFIFCVCFLFLFFFFFWPKVPSNNNFWTRLIWPINETVKDTANPGKSWPGSHGKEEVHLTRQISRNVVSSSDVV